MDGVTVAMSVRASCRGWQRACRARCRVVVVPVCGVGDSGCWAGRGGACCNTSVPWRAGRCRGSWIHDRDDREDLPAMLLCLDAGAVAADLAAGTLAYPSCQAGRLAPWGYGRERAVRLRGGFAGSRLPFYRLCRESCGPGYAGCKMTRLRSSSKPARPYIWRLTWVRRNSAGLEARYRV